MVKQHAPSRFSSTAPVRLPVVLPVASPSLLKKVGVVVVIIWILFLYQHQQIAQQQQQQQQQQQHPNYIALDPVSQTLLCSDYRNHNYNFNRSTGTGTGNIIATAESTSKTEHTQSRTVSDDVDDYHELMQQRRERSCKKEFTRITTDMTDHVHGLTKEDYERSVAHVGNRHRLSTFVRKLTQSSSTSTNKRRENYTSSDSDTAVTVIVCGGSITMGHGVEPQKARYSDALEVWLNDAYPLNTTIDFQNNENANDNDKDQQQQRHRVYFRGGHGANICAMAKRMNYLNLPSRPDLFILEFAVNNYQAEDHHTYLDHKADVYFDGFDKFVECTEIVIGRILTEYPDTAIIFLDMHSAVPNRKTAQSLHVGVAQHYQIPVISYADVMMPDYFRLIAALKPYNYALPSNMVQQMEIDFPFPHGCSQCHLEDLTEQFRPDGCWSLCSIMKVAEVYTPGLKGCDSGRQILPCYVPIFDHDEVHPSKIGHKIARDLIINLIAGVAYDICQGYTFTPHLLPVHGGWIVAPSSTTKPYMSELLALSDFVIVQDVKFNFADTAVLTAYNQTKGFAIVDDVLGRKGWIAHSSSGGESVTFSIDVPIEKCYAVFLTILKSYKTVGKLTVTIFDTSRNEMTKSIDVDCLWGPRISVPVDVQLTLDGSTDCTGKCNVTVTTHPEIKGRGGNLIKITSLSARRCA